MPMCIQGNTDYFTEVISGREQNLSTCLAAAAVVGIPVVPLPQLLLCIRFCSFALFCMSDNLGLSSLVLPSS